MKLQTLLLSIFCLVSGATLSAQPPIQTDTKTNNTHKKTTTKEKVIKVILCNGTIVTYRTR